MFPPRIPTAHSTTFHASCLAAICAFISGAAAFAVDATSEPKTYMAERTKLLFRDDLKEAQPKGWTAPKGKWELADGALRGSEQVEDKHGAVMRHPIAFRDAVIQYSFKLEGAKVTTLSINAAKGHLCRVLIRQNGFTVQKDDRDHAGSDKAVILQTVDTPIKPGEWHTLVVEILGREMLASLDGERVAFGAQDAIAEPKANLGLTVAGASASFKDLRVWEAAGKTDWGATKAKLTERRGGAE